MGLLRRKAVTANILKDTVGAQQTFQGRAGHEIDLWVWVLTWEHYNLQNIYFEREQRSIEVDDSVCLWCVRHVVGRLR